MELVAGANAWVRFAYPLWTLLEDVYEAAFKMEIGANSWTARLDILQHAGHGGRTRKKDETQGISEHDCCHVLEYVVFQGPARRKVHVL